MRESFVESTSSYRALLYVSTLPESKIYPRLIAQRYHITKRSGLLEPGDMLRAAKEACEQQFLRSDLLFSLASGTACNIIHRVP